MSNPVQISQINSAFKLEFTDAAVIQAAPEFDVDAWADKAGKIKSKTTSTNCLGFSAGIDLEKLINYNQDIRHKTNTSRLDEVIDVFDFKPIEFEMRGDQTFIDDVPKEHYPIVLRYENCSRILDTSAGDYHWLRLNRDGKIYHKRGWFNIPEVVSEDNGFLAMTEHNNLSKYKFFGGIFAAPSTPDIERIEASEGVVDYDNSNRIRRYIQNCLQFKG